MDILLTQLSAPTLWLLAQTPVTAFTILGVLIMIALILWGLCLARMRFSPLWVLIILVPVLVIPALWVLAFAKWPVEKSAEKANDSAG